MPAIAIIGLVGVTITIFSGLAMLAISIIEETKKISLWKEKKIVSTVFVTIIIPCITLGLLFCAFYIFKLGPARSNPWIYILSQKKITVTALYITLFVQYYAITEIWFIERKIIKKMIGFIIKDTIKEISNINNSISDFEVSEQSIEIEVETPQIVIQRQSKPADRTKAKLQKLKELHDEGLISDEDYNEEKRNILKEM